MAAHRPLLDYHRTSRYTGLKERQLRALVEQRKIPFLKIGRLIRFDPADLDAWLDGQKVVTAHEVVAS